MVDVVGGAADEGFLGLELPEPAGIHPGDQLLDLGHDLGTDTVAGKQEELVGGHGGNLAWHGSGD
jgi:hypothetical protein